MLLYNLIWNNSDDFVDQTNTSHSELLCDVLLVDVEEFWEKDLAERGVELVWHFSKVNLFLVIQFIDLLKKFLSGSSWPESLTDKLIFVLLVHFSARENTRVKNN